MQDARHSILRLTSLNRETNFNADETIAMMQHTIMLESKVSCLLRSPSGKTTLTRLDFRSCLFACSDQLWHPLHRLLQGRRPPTD